MGDRLKLEFTGSQGDTLAGLLETPDTDPISYVLFAHCFTCGKDIAAASRISRALVAKGFAVMRFDFTGLGSSDGDFANTNFSSNVQDLVLAADYLRDNYQAPGLLIGHSLGGTAVLKAAHSIPESAGVVTIGSPADAEHVGKQFVCDLDAIERDGEADVSLAGRKFTIRLDQADHLLTKKQDAEYVATTIAGWASRYVLDPEAAKPAQKVSGGHLVVSERDRKFSQTIQSDDHRWIADEPAAVGGSNLGPDPYEHLLAALGSCTAMTMRMYANRKKWPVEHISIELDHSRDHGADCSECDEEHKQIDVITRAVSIVGDLDEKQTARMMEIADKCPVHRTMHNKLVVKTNVVT